MEMAPLSVECATLRACVLSLLTTLGAAATTAATAAVGGEAGSAARSKIRHIDESARWEQQLSRACAACRHAIRLHDRRGDKAGDFETRILHSPGGGGDDGGGGEGTEGGGGGGGSGGGRRDGNGEEPPATGAGSRLSRVESLRSMAAYAAHTLAERRGGWDLETSWVREVDWGAADVQLRAQPSVDAAGAGAASDRSSVRDRQGDGAAGGHEGGGGGDRDRGVGGLREGVHYRQTVKRVEGGGGIGLDTITAGVAAVDVEDDDEVADWDMWQSPCILQYSVTLLREHRTW